MPLKNGSGVNPEVPPFPPTIESVEKTAEVALKMVLGVTVPAWLEAETTASGTMTRAVLLAPDPTHRLAFSRAVISVSLNSENPMRRTAMLLPS